MKVVFFGNTGNLGFRVVEWLRKKGEDATLVTFRGVNNERSHPEWIQPGLKNGYPNWIHCVRKRGGLSYIWPPRAIKRLMDDADVVITTGVNVIGALCSTRPVAFIPVGSDMTELPFKCARPRDEVLSYLYRRRIGRVARILTMQDDCLWAARFLGVDEKLLPTVFPSDLDAINEAMDFQFKEAMERQYANMDFVIVAASRKNIDPTDRAYKGQEKFIYALSNYVKKHPDARFKVICGMHGKDVEAFRSLVEAYDLTEYFEYVEHLPGPKLHAAFALSNAIVMDQFGLVAEYCIGGVTREALSVGGQVVAATRTNSEWFAQLYGSSCPIIPAFDPQAIMNAIEEFAVLSPEGRAARKRQTRQWAIEQLDWKFRMDEMIDTLREAAKQGAHALKESGMQDSRK